MNKQEIFILSDDTLSQIIDQILETKEKIIALVSIRTLINFFNKNTIRIYGNNRSGCFDESRCERMVDKFNINGLNSINVSIDKKTKTLMLLDFHHRMETLIRKNDLAELSSKELDTLFAINIFHYNEAISTYQIINAAKGHTGTEKINNPDLAIGSIIESIVSKAGIELDKKHSQNLMDAVFAYKEYKNDMTLHDFFSSRPKVTELLDTAKDRRTFSIDSEIEYKTAHALQIYTMIKNFILNHETSSAQARQAVKKPGFFIACVTDDLTDGNMFGITKNRMDSILKYINDRPHDFLEASELIARRSIPKIIDAKQRKPTGLDIFKVFRNRSK
jgi:hypothetical protein